MSTKDQAKKRLEDYFLDILAENLQDFPTGPRIASESPDFKIDDYAIEVTRLLSPQLKAIESRENKVIQKVRILAESRGIPPLWVTISFTPSDFDIETLALTLCDILQNNIPHLNASVVLRWPQLPSVLSSVRISLVRCFNRSCYELRAVKVS